MDPFLADLTALLTANPRLTPNGCNLQGDIDTDKWEKYQSDFVERQRKLCAFINQHIPAPTQSGGRVLVGSYGLKHIIERQNWTEDTNRYVSNGECIVAMMMCGYTPRWSKDRSSPNCEFSVKRKDWKAFVVEWF